jgi:hypothetical protein
MRILKSAILAAALVAVGAISVAQPAKAQTYDPNFPVCMRVFGDPTYFECRFQTIAQCKGTASGRGAECLVNPYFASAAVNPAHRRHHAY